MKKVLVTLVAIFALSTAMMAQNNAIGVRGAFGTGYGAELSWLHGLSNANRMEFDLGWSGHDDWNYVNVTGIYQWNWNIVEGLGWFAGVGANVGVYTDTPSDDDDNFGIGLDAQIGLEYQFNIPIQLSLDWRPMWEFVGNSGFGYGAAFGIRYVF